MDSIKSKTTFQLSGPNSLMNSKPNSKIQKSNNKKESHLKTAVYNGPILHSILPISKNMPDKPDTPKETLKPLTSFSKDFQQESS